MGIECSIGKCVLKFIFIKETFPFLLRQEGKGQDTGIKGMMQRLAPGWRKSQLPIDSGAQDGET